MTRKPFQLQKANQIFIAEKVKNIFSIIASGTQKGLKYSLKI